VTGDWGYAAAGAVALLFACNVGIAVAAAKMWRRNRRLDEKLAERNSKLHAFAVELIRAEEDQRTRIARELHDGLGQIMTAVNIELQMLHESAPSPMQPRVDDVRALARQVMTEMRRISHELRPAILDEMGLAEAVRALAERMSKHAHIDIDYKVEGNVDRLPADSKTACYRLVQEALNNVVRHANAKRAEVLLVRDGERLTVTVTDDGRGIRYDPSAPEANRDGHFGLMGMQERIRAIGGTFRFGAPPDRRQGTQIKAELPVA
jgi:two-component system, NarL family, sensor histidine kinase UhpB